jgi:hypothetical protein
MSLVLWDVQAKEFWLRGKDLNLRPLGYEPNELPDCSTPHLHPSVWLAFGQRSPSIKFAVGTRTMELCPALLSQRFSR